MAMLNPTSTERMTVADLIALLAQRNPQEEVRSYDVGLKFSGGDYIYIPSGPRSIWVDPPTDR
jgi:hypothetical protein